MTPTPILIFLFLVIIIDGSINFKKGIGIESEKVYKQVGDQKVWKQIRDQKSIENKLKMVIMYRTKIRFLKHLLSLF